MPKFHTATPKSNLKLVKPTKPSQQARRWTRAPADMPADRYTVVCESAAKVTKFGRPTAELQFTVVNGDYMGVCLSMWIRMDFRAGRLKPGCLYERCCEIALDGELTDDLSPALFVGKIFLAEVTYARTDGKSRTLQDDSVRKWEGDSLRVTRLVCLSGL